MEEIKVGKVSDYFGKVGVAAITVEGQGIKVGDTLHFKGHTTDLTQKIESIEMEHQKIEVAKPGDSIGIKVDDRVRRTDTVYKVVVE